MMFLPKILIGKRPTFSNLDELIKIYPEIKHKIVNFDRLENQLIFENGLRQLLMDNRLDDFHRIAETEKIFKTCHIVINNKLINCSKVETGIFQRNPELMIINELTYSGIVDKNQIEKITLSLNPFQLLLVEIFLSHSNNITKTSFIAEPKTRTKLSFSSFSVRKLNSIRNKCISEEELIKFGEDYFDLIASDCTFKSLNHSYGCILPSHAPIYFNKHILKNGYKFCKNLTLIFDSVSKIYEECKNSNVTIDSVNKIYEECRKRSKPKCNLINFNSKIETTKLLSNEIILEFIPKKTPRIAYTETYKTDFNGFIYNFGGVVGLWFGLTPIKLVDIFKYLTLVSKILISKSIKFVHYLKAISFRFAQNSVGICKRFGLYLFGIGVRFAQSSFRVCKPFGIYLFRIGVRFAQNSVGICKRFGLYLFGIGVKFAQNLIGICKRFAVFFITNIITFTYNLIAILMRFVRHLFRMNSTEN
jgi:hypothetical protein